MSTERRLPALRRAIGGNLDRTSRLERARVAQPPTLAAAPLRTPAPLHAVADLPDAQTIEATSGAGSLVEDWRLLSAAGVTLADLDGYDDAALRLSRAGLWQVDLALRVAIPSNAGFVRLAVHDETGSLVRRYWEIRIRPAIDATAAGGLIMALRPGWLLAIQVTHGAVDVDYGGSSRPTTLSCHHLGDATPVLNPSDV